MAKRYDPNQPRDRRGRWTTVLGGGRRLTTALSEDGRTYVTTLTGPEYGADAAAVVKHGMSRQKAERFHQEESLRRLGLGKHIKAARGGYRLKQSPGAGVFSTPKQAERALRQENRARMQADPFGEFLNRELITPAARVARFVAPSKRRSSRLSKREIRRQRAAMQEAATDRWIREHGISPATQRAAQRQAVEARRVRGRDVLRTRRD